MSSQILSLWLGDRSDIAYGCRTGLLEYVAWRAGTTILSHSRLYPPSQVLRIRPQAGGAEAGPALPQPSSLPTPALQAGVAGALPVRLVPHLLLHCLLHTHHAPPLGGFLDCQECDGAPARGTQARRYYSYLMNARKFHIIPTTCLHKIQLEAVLRVRVWASRILLSPTESSK